MNKKTIKRFEKERQYHTDELIKELLFSGNLTEAIKHRDWLEISEPIIDDYYKNKNNIFWHLSIALICLLIIAYVWTGHIKSIQLSFEAISPNVNIKLSENWKLRTSFKISDLYINNLNTVLSPEININFSRVINGKEDNTQETAILEINGNNIRLKELNLSKDALIDLKLENNRLSLYSKGKPLSGMIIVENANLILIEPKEDEVDKILKTIQDTEIIDFTSSETISAPVQLKLSFCSKTWKIKGLYAKSISFNEEYPPGSGKFESTIKSANIKLLETDKEITLRENECLLTTINTTQRLEFSQSKEGIKIFFQGTVSAISGGSPGFEKNLAPTYIEYLYHQKKTGLFWSSILFLWSFLWSLKNIFWDN